MELNVHNENSSGNVKTFRIASGVVAVAAAIYVSYSFFLRGNGIDTLRIVFIHPWYAIYLGPILVIASMIVCAIYVFAHYGKKPSTPLGASAALLAGGKILNCIAYVSAIGSNPSGTEGIVYASFMTTYIINMISLLLIGIIFIIIAVKFLSSNVNINLRLFLIVAITIEVITRILSVFIRIVFFDVIDLVFSWIYIVPFLLLALFCPLTNKTVGSVVSTSRLQEQESAVGDLSAQLRNLKEEFENGRITQQEYDVIRGRLLEKM